ncbi:MAG: hypothetical protein IKI11_07950 [Neisseriaceae bacterium]|nr:hypothetical protein [Neisseriaceae bacterium]
MGILAHRQAARLDCGVGFNFNFVSTHHLPIRAKTTFHHSANQRLAALRWVRMPTL